ncbi:hypothetical protein SCHPADRAFT_903069 [Schizopora paradoxa]|uniref:Uncharacterized protein n=1 Tax=Schizopora paradoxa TaxID=27342 RepID=A0A0H2RYS1_9AGAM|nr:hypothetical protein SCHPADRAFT_903069 [Schizopora paradoxa]
MRPTEDILRRQPPNAGGNSIQGTLLLVAIVLLLVIFLVATSCLSFLCMRCVSRGGRIIHELGFMPNSRESVGFGHPGGHESIALTNQYPVGHVEADGQRSGANNFHP